MAVTYNKFNIFLQDICQKKHNLASDQITVALCATANAPVATNTVLANLTEISYTNLTSRNVTTTSCTQSSGTLSLVLVNLTLTASTGDVTFQYAVFYNSTASGGPLIGWYDYGSALTLHGANGDSLTINLTNSNNLFQIS